jgi:ribosomal-protein-serine acetyltransferase
MFKHRINETTELRLIERHHAEEMLRLIRASRLHLDTWLRWSAAIKTLADVEEHITRYLRKFAEGDGFHAGIWHEGHLAGGILVYYLNRGSNKTEIGGWLGGDYTGQGLATIASCAVIDYLLLERGLNRVEIQCGIDNQPSRAVAERLHFTQEGVKRQSEIINGEYVDHVVYSMLAEEWPAKRDA